MFETAWLHSSAQYGQRPKSIVKNTQPTDQQSPGVLQSSHGRKNKRIRTKSFRFSTPLFGVSTLPPQGTKEKAPYPFVSTLRGRVLKKKEGLHFLY